MRGHRRRWESVAAAVCVGVVAASLAACSSTGTPSASAPGTAAPPIPSSAFSDHTGVSPTSVTIANVTTLTAGLFRGSLVGVEAYAAYVNSQGGVAGRKIVVSSADDSFQGQLDKQDTATAIQQDFASVGGFSLEDSFSQSEVASHPGFPEVTASLDPATQALPNNFSPLPASNGWPTGPLLYFKQKYPSRIRHVGTIIANLPSTELAWSNEKRAMEHLGYTVRDDPALPATTTDFTQQVLTMKNDGVQLLFLEQEPQNYASAIFRDLTQQNFHPIVVLGSPSYNNQLVANAGGAQATEGAYLEQPAALYLGGDAAQLPVVPTFTTWVQRVAPGFSPDFFTLEGWLSAELFTQALRHAGSDPSRGSLLQALRQITSFSSQGLAPVSNPAGKVPVTCYLLGQITGGTFQRLDDPPISGPTQGYRCDGTYYRG